MISGLDENILRFGSIIGSTMQGVHKQGKGGVLHVQFYVGWSRLWRDVAFDRAYHPVYRCPKSCGVIVVFRAKGLIALPYLMPLFGNKTGFI
jgi:hypothetical protein